jgi:undecaprenyl pyrophosphate phosphatase UppP
MFVKVEIFGVESKSKRGFEKGGMHLVITIDLITIVSSILAFQRKLIPMFSHMDSIKKFKNYIRNWRSTIIVIMIIGVRGIRDKKHEKKLLIINVEGEFNVLTICHNPSLKLVTKAKVYKGVSQEGNLGVTSDALESVGECEGMNTHTPK